MLFVITGMDSEAILLSQVKKEKYHINMGNLNKTKQPPKYQTHTYREEKVVARDRGVGEKGV